MFSGFFSSGWGRNLFCTRDDCTTQLQWWKSCQVCFSVIRQKVRNDWFRAPSERLLLGDWTSQRSYGTCSGGASNWTSFTEWVQQQHICTVCISFFELGNFQHHVWWSLCPRYMVEEGDTLAGIALRLPHISTKWKLCYHSLLLSDSTSRSRTWNRQTNCGPMRAFGLASLSEYHTLRWEQLCSSIQSMIFILHII